MANTATTSSGEMQPPKLYDWTQTEKDVTITYTGKTELSKTDVEWSLSARRLRVVVCGRTLLEGALGGTCDVDASTWTLDRNK